MTVKPGALLVSVCDSVPMMTDRNISSPAKQSSNCSSVPCHQDSQYHVKYMTCEDIDDHLHLHIICWQINIYIVVPTPPVNTQYLWRIMRCSGCIYWKTVCQLKIKTKFLYVLWQKHVGVLWPVFFGSKTKMDRYEYYFNQQSLGLDLHFHNLWKEIRILTFL